MITDDVGPCVVVKDLETFVTLGFILLHFGVITSVRFTVHTSLMIKTSEWHLFLLDFKPQTPSLILTFPSYMTRCAVHEDDVLISTVLDVLILLHINSDALEIAEPLFPNLCCPALNLSRYDGVLIRGIASPNGSVLVYVPSIRNSVTLNGSAQTFGIAFATDHDGRNFLFAAGSQDRTIRIWRVASGAVSTISWLDVAVASAS
jgi:WD40 repeat protein